MYTGKRYRLMILIAVAITVTLASSQLRADTGACGGASIALPFTDVASSNIFFCSIAEAFFSGLTNGTTATTYSPSDAVSREQMAAFVTRTMDQSVKRASRRAALDQFWTNQAGSNLALTTVGTSPGLVKSDGADLWVSNGDSTVSRVRASDGRLIETWTGAAGGSGGVLVAMGKIFVTGATDPSGTLYQIDPTQPPGAVTIFTSGLGNTPTSIAFDGQRIWIANEGNGGSVSIVTLNPLNVTTVTTGLIGPLGLIYDGANIWVTAGNSLKKLDSSGNIIMSVAVETPQFPAFDGTNIWVPDQDVDAVTVVRATGSLAGTVLANLHGNGLLGPAQAAFDGERVLVTNPIGRSVSLWRAADFTPIGTFPTGPGSVPIGVCSDGLNFWITLNGAGKLARF